MRRNFPVPNDPTTWCFEGECLAADFDDGQRFFDPFLALECGGEFETLGDFANATVIRLIHGRPNHSLDIRAMAEYSGTVVGILAEIDNHRHFRYGCPRVRTH